MPERLRVVRSGEVDPPLERFEADEARRRLEETESRFRIMADTAPVLLWMAGLDALCDFFNEGWLTFTGRSMADELGNGWAEGIHPEDFARSMDLYLEAFVTRKPFTMEYRLRRADGEYRWVFDQGAPRFDGGGRFVGFIGSCVDVTAQREARDALNRLNQVLEERVRERTALARDREMLLREVHHRTKNDLQLISSLLSIQGRQLGDVPAARALEECQARVQAIAQIHEAMYQSDRPGQMSFSEHMRTMMAHVRRVAPGSGVRIEFDLDQNVELTVDRAIPCGLIVHELVVNACKHAFPNGRQSSVKVTCNRSAAGAVRIIVEDDGVGIPEAPCQPRGGLGWTLIEAFTKQLAGTVEVVRERGTRVELQFADATSADAASS